MQEQFNRASQLHQQGKYREAEALYRSLTSLEPENPIVNARLAMVLVQTKRAREALPLFALAIDNMPQDTALIKQAVNVASQLGENVFAEKWVRLLLEESPDDMALSAQYVGILIAVHKEEAALALVNALLKKQPQNAQLLNFKGMCLSRLSEGDKAYRYFEKALRANPGQVGVVRNLIVHGKGKKQALLEEIVPQYEQRLRQRGLNEDAKMNIAYVVSMYYDRKGDAEKSFKYLQMGNTINRSRYHYAHSEMQDVFSKIIEALSGPFLGACESLPKVEDRAAPIFILGMPRSGTTLVEQILSSHSRVGAEGELQVLSECFQRETEVVMSSADAGVRAEAAQRAFVNYLSQVRAMQAQRGNNLPEFFTDKMPYNYMMAGFIAAALPEAKIIHCTRDPLETCFSIYKQNFAGTHSYKNELRELGMYYNLYEQLMATLVDTFPGRIYDANYERMVSDSESEIQRLLDYCDLEMESACLMFHKNKRAVRTASIAQVRQPIYKDAVKASKPFEKQLAPLIDVLKSGEGRL
jgi:tetratricopeptide (TPR) repeat protein